MTRRRKFTLFLALAITGGIGIGFAAFLAVAPVRNAAPEIARILVGTLIVAFAMAWAFFFATRAHGVQDEFKRQREISAGYWGGWLGIAGSTPLFFFIAAHSLRNPALMHVPPVIVFTVGYILPPVCGAIGAVGARLWLRHRDSQQ